MKHFQKTIRLWCCIFVVMLSITTHASSIELQKGKFQLVVAAQEDAPVCLAAQTLSEDFAKVMHFSPQLGTVANNSKGVDIIIINEATADAKKYAKELRPLDDFESHRIYCDVEKQRIYLLGKDMRGTIYAIYTFSEEFLGVPALWFYSDWVPEYKKTITMSSDYDHFMKTPQVRYRTWFPNDEDLLRVWRPLSKDNNEKWLEAMLRLKLNTVEHGSTVTYPDYKLGRNAELLRKYGLILTSHHMVGLNNSFANWDGYWTNVRKMDPPKLLISNEKALKEFWQYCVETVCRDKQENLWQIAFRGRSDEPFWAAFEDAPKTDKERAEVINRMIRIQYDMIKKSTGENDPFVRMTFYDEISDLLAKGYLKPPTSDNMLWTFVAGRRDHYPYDDLVAFDPSQNVKLGYYMNLQFTSTGAHLAPAEGPWKMEDNYRYVNSKGPLTLSVVNSGNFREFVMEMAANASMMWDMQAYNTDAFLLDFSAQYFGKQNAPQVAQLYHDYYYAFWEQKPSEFPGLDRQFIFQDLRYSQVFNQISAKFDKFSSNPLEDIGFERMPGRSFRLTGTNQVDTLLAGMHKTARKFDEVALSCDEMMKELPVQYQAFFNTNLASYSRYMAAISHSLYHFIHAYKYPTDRVKHLEQSRDKMIEARDALYTTQSGAFAVWYKGDDVGEKSFGFNRKINMLDNLMKKHQN